MRPFSLLRRHTWTVAIGLIAVLIVGGAYAKRSGPQQLTGDLVSRGDIKQTLHAVGIVSAEQDSDLHFAGFNAVAKVLVKEGDTVTKGQVLATLRSDGLDGLLTTATASVQTAQLQLAALQQGARPEEIAVLIAQQQSNRANLDRAQKKLQAAQDAGVTAEQDAAALQQQADARLAAEVATVNTVIPSQYATAKSALSAMQSIFDRIEVQDSIAKDGSSDYTFLRSQQLSAQQNLDAQAARGVSVSDAPSAVGALRDASAAIQATADVLDRGSDLLSRLPITEYYTAAKQEASKQALAGQAAQVHAALGMLDTAVKNIQNAQVAIATPQTPSTTASRAKEDALAEIASIQADMRVTDAQIAQKQAPPLPGDIQQAQARVRQAEGDLARVSSQFSDAQLRAPSDGTIVHINAVTGQFPSMTEPAMVLRGNAERSILVYLTDADITRIGASAYGTVQFDAFPGQTFALRAENLRASVSKVNGVDDYRTLSFVSSHPDLPVGMNGDVTLLVGDHQNAVRVRSELVEQGSDGKTYVHVQSGRSSIRLPVVTGLHGDDGFTEIIQGLSGGESLLPLDTAS